MKYIPLIGLLFYSVAMAMASDQAGEPLLVADPLSQTNTAEVAAAVEAMVVEKGDVPTQEIQAQEDVEIEEIVRKEEAKKKASPPKEINPWEDFYPPADSQFDWLQLTSGEWLKGEFKVMYDFILEFDSDEMGLHEFDFTDVAQLRTRTMQSIFLEEETGRRDTTILRGMLVIKDDQVTLLRREHEVSFPRNRVISIAGGHSKERNFWSGSASVGLNARGGNTETADITVMADVKRRTARSRLMLDYLANYSSAKQIKSADNQRVTGFFDWFLTSRLYWQILEVEYYRDPFTNIDGQYSIATSIGYDLIRTPRTEWTINAGFGYQELRFVSVIPGSDASSVSPFITTGTRLDYELTKNIDLLYDYSMRFLNEDNGQYTHRMRGSVSFDLMGDFDLDVSVIWDYVREPTPLNNGGVITVPEQGDYQLIVSLAYDF